MIKKYNSEHLPDLFKSYDTKEAFSHCLICNEALEHKHRYAVEKVFKQNQLTGVSEIIYEYAICFDCATEVGDEISEESMEAIQNLYEAHSQNMMMKLDYLHSTEKYNIESWTERCSFTAKEIRLCSEYSVSGIIENGQLVYEHAPIVVSDLFMEKIQDCMSKKTRDYFDGFKDEYFDLPPELKDLINGPTVGII